MTTRPANSVGRFCFGPTGLPPWQDDGGQKKMATNTRLRAARVLLDLTQRDLAERVGLKEIEISRLETGRATPTPEIKARIAEVLKRSAYELFDA